MGWLTVLGRLPLGVFLLALQSDSCYQDVRDIVCVVQATLVLGTATVARSDGNSSVDIAAHQACAGSCFCALVIAGQQHMVASRGPAGF